MSEDQAALSGPDLTQGIPLSQLRDGQMLAGHSHGKPVLLARRGDEFLAVGAACTHYSAPLGDGLLIDDTVRCPWHHACFSLRTGEAVRAPALNPIARWEVELRDGKIYVTRELEVPDGATPAPARAPVPNRPSSIVIIGGGAAGNAAAEMLRREGYDGPVTMISADEALPCDRPNLSKDYLAGTAPEEWIPLHPAEFYPEHGIDLVRGVRATGINAVQRYVTLENGQRLAFDRLLLATGADPVQLPLPGAELPHVHYLRTLADSRAIIKTAKRARRAVVMGASFIGLEVAAALRGRKLEVQVVAPDARPLERVMGQQLGDFIRQLHERNGVVFHLRQVASAIAHESVTLEGGEVLPADLVVIGVGVRPALALAEGAGLATDRGVLVNAYLETSVPGIFAAGDIASWPDPRTGERIRVEHWVVAERQGQTAARNMLGRRERFQDVPFFWSAHYDTSIRYVGHAQRWDEITVDGDLAAGDATVSFHAGGRTLAVATVGRDQASLQAELALEREAESVDATVAR